METTYKDSQHRYYLNTVKTFREDKTGIVYHTLEYTNGEENITHNVMLSCMQLKIPMYIDESIDTYKFEEMIISKLNI